MQFTDSKTELLSLDLARIESFGDNCELGFVLRRLGCDDGSLFRWASMDPESLLATLRGDFDQIYEFDNLEPCRTAMVRDRHYGTAWHSGLTSSTRDDGQRVFDVDEPSRRAIYSTEKEKRLHLVEKLHRKFAHPNPVFVIKHNKGISSEVLEGIHYQLYRRVASGRFVLLEVCADESRAGRIEAIERNRMRGCVSYFASYDRANEADDPSWHSLLKQALAEHADIGHAVPRPTALDAIALPFPTAIEPSYRHRLQGDLRAGSVRLHHGSQWCRLVDDDHYRLHAREIGDQATKLEWNGIRMPAGCTVHVQAACAISESKPVRATLTIKTAQDETYSCVRLVCGMSPHSLRVPMPDRISNPVSASLVVEPLERLVGGDRAVIDLAPIEIAALQNSRILRQEPPKSKSASFVS